MEKRFCYTKKKEKKESPNLLSPFRYSEKQIIFILLTKVFFLNKQNNCVFYCVFFFYLASAETFFFRTIIELRKNIESFEQLARIIQS